MDSPEIRSQRRVIRALRPDLFRSWDDSYGRSRLLVIAVGVGLFVSTLFWRFFFEKNGPILCYSRSVFGLPCPGCGLTRAFCALAELDLKKALEMNALCFPIGLFVLLATVVAIVELKQRQKFFWYTRMFTLKNALITGGVIVVYHLARLACWFLDGTLMGDYFEEGLVYKIFWN